MKILFISLGCDKNLVDTEVMLGLLASKGYEMTDDEQEADIIVINTCCFIHDAKEESIQNILEMAELKKEGRRVAFEGQRTGLGNENVCRGEGRGQQIQTTIFRREDGR